MHFIIYWEALPHIWLCTAFPDIWGKLSFLSVQVLAMEELREHWRESRGEKGKLSIVPRWKDLASSRNFGRITRFRRQKNARWSQAHKHEINIQRGLTYVVLFFLSNFFSFIRSWEAESTYLENLTQKLSRKILSSLKKTMCPEWS